MIERSHRSSFRRGRTRAPDDRSGPILSFLASVWARQCARGDEVVQPGPHDGNGIEAIRFDGLKRSHAGVAGDCAVASIEGRQFKL